METQDWITHLSFVYLLIKNLILKFQLFDLTKNGALQSAMFVWFEQDVLHNAKHSHMLHLKCKTPMDN